MDAHKHSPIEENFLESWWLGGNAIVCVCVSASHPLDLRVGTSDFGRGQTFMNHSKLKTDVGIPHAEPNHFFLAFSVVSSSSSIVGGKTTKFAI